MANKSAGIKSSYTLEQERIDSLKSLLQRIDSPDIDQAEDQPVEPEPIQASTGEMGVPDLEEDDVSIEDLLNRFDQLNAGSPVAIEREQSSSTYIPPIREELEKSTLEKVFESKPVKLFMGAASLGTSVPIGIGEALTHEGGFEIGERFGKLVKSIQTARGFGDIARERGIDNFWLGVGLDIILDPTTYASFGVLGATKVPGQGGKFIKHIKSAQKNGGRLIAKKSIFGSGLKPLTPVTEMADGTYQYALSPRGQKMFNDLLKTGEYTVEDARKVIGDLIDNTEQGIKLVHTGGWRMGLPNPLRSFARRDIEKGQEVGRGYLEGLVFSEGGKAFGQSVSPWLKNLKDHTPIIGSKTIGEKVGFGLGGAISLLAGLDPDEGFRVAKEFNMGGLMETGMLRKARTTKEMVEFATKKAYTPEVILSRSVGRLAPLAFATNSFMKSKKAEFSGDTLVKESERKLWEFHLKDFAFSNSTGKEELDKLIKENQLAKATYLGEGNVLDDAFSRAITSEAKYIHGLERDFNPDQARSLKEIEDDLSTHIINNADIVWDADQHDDIVAMNSQLKAELRNVRSKLKKAGEGVGSSLRLIDERTNGKSSELMAEIMKLEDGLEGEKLQAAIRNNQLDHQALNAGYQEALKARNKLIEEYGPIVDRINQLQSRNEGVELSSFTFAQDVNKVLSEQNLVIDAMEGAPSLRPDTLSFADLDVFDDTFNDQYVPRNIGVDFGEPMRQNEFVEGIKSKLVGEASARFREQSRLRYAVDRPLFEANQTLIPQILTPKVARSLEDTMPKTLGVGQMFRDYMGPISIKEANKAAKNGSLRRIIARNIVDQMDQIFGVKPGGSKRLWYEDEVDEPVKELAQYNEVVLNKGLRIMERSLRKANRVRSDMAKGVATVLTPDQIIHAAMKSSSVREAAKMMRASNTRPKVISGISSIFGVSPAPNDNFNKFMRALYQIEGEFGRGGKFDRQDMFSTSPEDIMQLTSRDLSVYKSRNELMASIARDFGKTQEDLLKPLMEEYETARIANNNVQSLSPKEIDDLDSPIIHMHSIGPKAIGEMFRQLFKKTGETVNLYDNYRVYKGGNSFKDEVFEDANGNVVTRKRVDINDGHGVFFRDDVNPDTMRFNDGTTVLDRLLDHIGFNDLFVNPLASTKGGMAGLNVGGEKDNPIYRAFVDYFVMAEEPVDVGAGRLRYSDINDEMDHNFVQSPLDKNRKVTHRRAVIEGELLKIKGLGKSRVSSIMSRFDQVEAARGFEDFEDLAKVGYGIDIHAPRAESPTISITKHHKTMGGKGDWLTGLESDAALHAHWPEELKILYQHQGSLPLYKDSFKKALSTSKRSIRSFIESLSPSPELRAAYDRFVNSASYRSMKAGGRNSMVSAYELVEALPDGHPFQSFVSKSLADYSSVGEGTVGDVVEFAVHSAWKAFVDNQESLKKSWLTRPDVWDLFGLIPEGKKLEDIHKKYGEIWQDYYNENPDTFEKIRAKGHGGRSGKGSISFNTSRYSSTPLLGNHVSDNARASDIGYDPFSSSTEIARRSMKAIDSFTGNIQYFDVEDIGPDDFLPQNMIRLLLDKTQPIRPQIEIPKMMEELRSMLAVGEVNPETGEIDYPTGKVGIEDRKVQAKLKRLVAYGDQISQIEFNASNDVDKMIYLDLLDKYTMSFGSEKRVADHLTSLKEGKALGVEPFLPTEHLSEGSQRYVSRTPGHLGGGFVVRPDSKLYQKGKGGVFKLVDIKDISKLDEGVAFVLPRNFEEINGRQAENYIKNSTLYSMGKVDEEGKAADQSSGMFRQVRPLAEVNPETGKAESASANDLFDGADFYVKEQRGVPLNITNIVTNPETQIGSAVFDSMLARRVNKVEGRNNIKLHGVFNRADGDLQVDSNLSQADLLTAQDEGWFSIDPYVWRNKTLDPASRERGYDENLWIDPNGNFYDNTQAKIDQDADSVSIEDMPDKMQWSERKRRQAEKIYDDSDAIIVIRDKNEKGNGVFNPRYHFSEGNYKGNMVAVPLKYGKVSKPMLVIELDTLMDAGKSEQKAQRMAMDIASWIAENNKGISAHIEGKDMALEGSSINSLGIMDDTAVGRNRNPQNPEYRKDSRRPAMMVFQQLMSGKSDGYIDRATWHRQGLADEDANLRLAKSVDKESGKVFDVDELVKVHNNGGGLSADRKVLRPGTYFLDVGRLDSNGNPDRMIIEVKKPMSIEYAYHVLVKGWGKHTEFTNLLASVDSGPEMIKRRVTFDRGRSTHPNHGEYLSLRNKGLAVFNEETQSYAPPKLSEELSKAELGDAEKARWRPSDFWVAVKAAEDNGLMPRLQTESGVVGVKPDFESGDVRTRRVLKKYEDGTIDKDSNEYIVEEYRETVEELTNDQRIAAYNELFKHYFYQGMDFDPESNSWTISDLNQEATINIRQKEINAYINRAKEDVHVEKGLQLVDPWVTLKRASKDRGVSPASAIASLINRNPVTVKSLPEESSVLSASDSLYNKYNKYKKQIARAQKVLNGKRSQQLSNWIEMQSYLHNKLKALTPGDISEWVDTSEIEAVTKQIRALEDVRPANYGPYESTDISTINPSTLLPEEIEERLNSIDSIMRDQLNEERMATLDVDYNNRLSFSGMLQYEDQKAKAVTKQRVNREGYITKQAEENVYVKALDVINHVANKMPADEVAKLDTQSDIQTLIDMSRNKRLDKSLRVYANEILSNFGSGKITKQVAESLKSDSDLFDFHLAASYIDNFNGRRLSSLVGQEGAIETNAGLNELYSKIVDQMSASEFSSALGSVVKDPNTPPNFNFLGGANATASNRVDLISHWMNRNGNQFNSNLSHLNEILSSGKDLNTSIDTVRLLLGQEPTATTTSLLRLARTDNDVGQMAHHILQGEVDHGNKAVVDKLEELSSYEKDLPQDEFSVGESVDVKRVWDEQAREAEQAKALLDDVVVHDDSIPEVKAEEVDTDESIMAELEALSQEPPDEPDPVPVDPEWEEVSQAVDDISMGKEPDLSPAVDQDAYNLPTSDVINRTLKQEEYNLPTSDQFRLEDNDVPSEIEELPTNSTGRADPLDFADESSETSSLQFTADSIVDPQSDGPPTLGFRLTGAKMPIQYGEFEPSYSARTKPQVEPDPIPDDVPPVEPVDVGGEVPDDEPPAPTPVESRPPSPHQVARDRAEYAKDLSNRNNLTYKGDLWAKPSFNGSTPYKFKRDGEDLWFDSVTRRHIERMYDLIQDDNAIKKTLRLYDEIHGGFKAITLFPFASYHLKNMFDGMFWRNQIAGVNSSEPYTYAHKMLAMHYSKDPSEYNKLKEGLGKWHGHKVENLLSLALRDKVISSKFALEQVLQTGPDASNTHSLIHKAMDTLGMKINKHTKGTTARWAEQISDWKATRAKDLEVEAKTGVEKAKQIAGKTAQVIHPIGPTLRTKKGFEINDYNESAMRLALMLDRLSKGDADVAATDMVKAVHFDYDELTPIERNVFKRMISFYTFASKNLPLHLKLKYGGAHRKFKPFNAIIKNMESPDDENTKLYMEEYILKDIPLRVHQKKNKDGSTTNSYFMLGRWISDTGFDDINTPAKWDALIASSMAGMVKPIMEALLNKRIRKISDIWSTTYPKEMIAKSPNESTSFLGIRFNNRVAHTLKMIRRYRELDRQNPGNMFGRGIDTFQNPPYEGQRSMFDQSPVGRRPELSWVDRLSMYFIGRSLYAIDPDKQKLIRLSRNRARSIMSAAKADYWYQVNDLIDFTDEGDKKQITKDQYNKLSFVKKKQLELVKPDKDPELYNELVTGARYLKQRANKQ